MERKNRKSGKESSSLKRKKTKVLLPVLLLVIISAGLLFLVKTFGRETDLPADKWFRNPVPLTSEPGSIDPKKLPAYSGNPVVEINGGVPFFQEQDLQVSDFQYYSKLDFLGRCGSAAAMIGPEMMPDEERGDISMVKPSGWQKTEYDCVDGGSLFNRCHLIGYQLTGQNANERNLVTGTRYMNVDGMQPFENRMAAYLKETGGHILLRVTPVYEGRNLVASGVLMEAQSVEEVQSPAQGQPPAQERSATQDRSPAQEQSSAQSQSSEQSSSLEQKQSLAQRQSTDDNPQLSFCIYCYNVQPGVKIDYQDGSSEEDPATLKLDPDAESVIYPGKQTEIPKDTKYVLNTNTMKFHLPDCTSVQEISEHNRIYSNESRDKLIAEGYSPCGICKP